MGKIGLRFQIEERLLVIKLPGDSFATEIGKLKSRMLLLLLFSPSVVSDSFVTPWTVAGQAPLSLGFPRQEYWNGLPFPSPGCTVCTDMNIYTQMSDLPTVHFCPV